MDTEDEIKEYVIIDNLLRRQLTPKKRAFLLDELSKVYEKERERDAKTGKFVKPKKAIEPIMGSMGGKEDVNTKTAKVANVSKNTVQRARAYVRAVKKDPKRYITSHLFLNGKRNHFAIKDLHQVSNASISLFQDTPEFSSGFPAFFSFIFSFGVFPFLSCLSRSARC